MVGLSVFKDKIVRKTDREMEKKPGCVTKDTGTLRMNLDISDGQKISDQGIACNQLSCKMEG